MVVMTIQMQVRPSKRKELLQTLDALRHAKLQEKGFLDALTFTQTGEENTLTLIEHWETQEDLDAYLHSYYFSVLRGALKMLTSSSEISVTTEPATSPDQSCPGMAATIREGTSS